MKLYNIPNPTVDLKEAEALDKFTERYEKLIKPNTLVKTGAKVGEKAVAVIPDKVKNLGIQAKEKISEQEIFAQAIKIAMNSFNVIEEQVAKYTISERDIIKKINKSDKNNNIHYLNEFCLTRSYNISKIANTYKTQELLIALIEGVATGYWGFAGIPANLALSTLLYYRAVQSVAMFYGYDVRNDPAELAIASEVFMNALNPSAVNSGGLSDTIVKVMVVSKATALKQSRKTWTQMAQTGGVELLLTQMRALANQSARKALEKAGKKDLENTMFSETLEQIGKKLSQKAIKGAVPYVSAAISGLIDLSQMNKVFDYADIFYGKRFILEKEERIHTLTGWTNDVIDIEATDNTVEARVKVKPRRIK